MASENHGSQRSRGFALRATMRARDSLRAHVRATLVRDGSTITHDPLRLRWRKKYVFADLDAEHFVGAEKGTTRMAVETKGFAAPSPIDSLEKALGQHTLYHDVLAQVDPSRTRYLAVSDRVYTNVFEEPMGALLLANGRLRLLVFNTDAEVVERWTPESPIAK